MQNRSSSDPQLFHCPTCGASLPAPEAASVRCTYCGSTVLVPPEFRPQKAAEQPVSPQPFVINLSEQLGETTPVSRRTVGLVIGILVLVCVVLMIIGGVMASAGIFASTALVGSSIEKIATQAIVFPTIPPELFPSTDTPIPTAVPVASLELQFGGKGSGPGQFDDSRYIAIAPDGSIFIAEYTSGRVQKFDPTGKFLQLINIQPDRNESTIIRDMDTDYRGNLYVVRGGDILVYNTSDGSLATTIPGQFPSTHYDALDIDPANNIFALHITAGETDLIRLDSQGQTVWRKAQITEGLVKKNEISQAEKVAVDGLGNIFLLDAYNSQVYRFDANGQYVGRFGSKGRESGQIEHPLDLTIDGQGRIFIIDTGSIDIFDSNGLFIDTIPWDYSLGSPFDLKFDLDQKLYLITNLGQALKYSVNLE